MSSVPSPRTLEDDPSPSLSFNRLIVVLAVLGATMGSLGVFLTVYLQSPVAGLDIPGLDMIRHQTHPSGESTLYSWYSTLVLAGIAVAFAVIAMVKWQSRPLGWRYLVLAATAALLSADEAALLHEKMSDVAGKLGLGWTWTYSWLIAAVPLAIVVGVFLVWLARAIDPVLRRRLILAGVLFFLGAVGMEAVGGLLETGTVGLADSAQVLVFHLSILVGECLEVAGALVALWAALAYLRVTPTSTGLVVTAND